MGQGIGSVDTALEDLLRAAEREVLVVIYSIGTGALPVLEALNATAARGISVILVANRFEAQPPEVQALLLRLSHDYDWSEVWSFSPVDRDEELHAKAFVVDRRRALVGSANVSRRGLLTNYELGVLLEGEPAADVARAIDRLRGETHLVRRVISPPDSPTTTR
jgi:cardiolipin synthase